MKNKAVIWMLMVGLLLAGAVSAWAQQPVNTPKAKEFRIERSMSKQAVACIECHKQVSPGIFVDWSMSRHASANITCLDCHQADPADPGVSATHYQAVRALQQQVGHRGVPRPRRRGGVAQDLLPLPSR